MAGAPENNQNAKKWNLSDKQKMFCEEYLIDLNATQAAKRARYSEKTAGRIAGQLLKKLEIQEYISYLKSMVSKKLELTHEMITKEFMKIAFSSISHLHNTWIEKKDFEDLKNSNPDILDCIQEIDTKVQYINKGEDKTPIQVEYVKLKLYSKTDALKELGKHTGYFEADNSQKRVMIKGITFDE